MATNLETSFDFDKEEEKKKNKSFFTSVPLDNPVFPTKKATEPEEEKEEKEEKEENVEELEDFFAKPDTVPVTENKTPVMPKADFSYSDKFIARSKQCEQIAWVAQPLTWMMFPLLIGSAAAGFAILPIIFTLLGGISWMTWQCGGMLKDVFEEMAIAEEKEVVKKNAPKLHEYYDECELAGIVPESPNSKLKTNKPLNYNLINQTQASQAAKASQESQKSTEQSK